MAVLLVSAAALVVLWVWIDSLRFADVDKRATAHLEAVKVASAIAVGGGGLFALYLAARRQRTQELELEVRREELRGRDLDAAERRVTELYAKAAEQLGSDKAPVRLAGMYALDRLANDNPQHRQLVIDLLCAYLRMPYAPDTGEAGEREVRLAAQGLLASRARPYVDPEDHERKNPRHWPELYDFNLAGATLIDLDLSGCRFGPAMFDGATFTGEADFRDAVFESGVAFEDAVFADGARFDSARFEVDANFMRARCKGHMSFHMADFSTDATFDGAHLGDFCIFSSASFSWNAYFRAVKFDEVAFDGASFDRDATFDRSWFQGAADFSKARFTRPIELEESAGSPTATSCFDEPSVWPEGWTFGGPVDSGGRWCRLVRS